MIWMTVMNAPREKIPRRTTFFRIGSWVLRSIGNGVSMLQEKPISIVLMRDKSNGEDLHDDIENYRDGSHAGVKGHCM